MNEDYSKDGSSCVYVGDEDMGEVKVYMIKSVLGGEDIPFSEKGRRIGEYFNKQIKEDER